MSYRRAFTLIELLVVVAILALIISILLPALAKARLSGWKAVSLNNIRQITICASMYREDNKQFWPITLTYPRGVARSATSGLAVGWATWQYGGKNNDGAWTTINGGLYDVEAADRPLNPYVYPDIQLEAPLPPARMPSDDPSRSTLKMPIFKDPADTVSYQRSKDAVFTKPEAANISSYDDVGTSYHYNIKWFGAVGSSLVASGVPLSTEKIFNTGTQHIRIADAYQTSRFVWLNDQFADIVVNNTSSNFELENGYGDVNRSVMGFLDGHAKYLRVHPGQGPEAYSNSEYTFILDGIRR